MWRAMQWAAVGCCGLFVLLSVVQAADEFAAPPQAERDVVATIGKGGGRITVDGEYRVIGVMTGNDNTNDDLKALAACERLTTVSIASPKVTDEGLAHLHGLKKLTSIGVNSTGTTAAGVDALRAALPDCRITTFGRFAPAAGGARAPGPANSGPGGRGGFSGGAFGSSASRTTSLLRNAAVQDDLKLTAEQKKQIAEASDNSAISAVLRLIDEKTLAVLTPEQKTRVKQLELQQSASTIIRADIAAQLRLSADQVAAITKVNEEHVATSQTAMRDLFAQRGNEAAEAITAKLREKVTELNKQRDEKVQAVLNEEQKKAWKEMIGPPGPAITSPFTSTRNRFGGGPANR